MWRRSLDNDYPFDKFGYAKTGLIQIDIPFEPVEWMFDTDEEVWRSPYEETTDKFEAITDSAIIAWTLERNST